MREAAALVVSTLLDKLEDILAKEDESNPPKLGGQWPRTLATCQRGPPDLDRGWYFYGVLDCASQLTSLVDPKTLRKGLVDRIEQLLFESKTPEYRWKAVSVPLQLRTDTRGSDYSTLRLILVSDRSTLVLFLYTRTAVREAQERIEQVTQEQCHEV